MAYEDDYLSPGPAEGASGPETQAEAPDVEVDEETEETPEGESSLFVSTDIVGDREAGDEIVFKVLGKNADGELEICVCDPDAENEFDQMERKRNGPAPVLA